MTLSFIAVQHFEDYYHFYCYYYYYFPAQQPNVGRGRLIL